MKLVPILEASYAGTATGGLSDKEMIKKYFIHDEQLMKDLNEGGSAYLEHNGIVKAFLPKQGLMGYYQFSGMQINFVLLLGNGTWSIEDGAQAYPCESLEGLQLHQIVYAQ